MQLLLSLVLLTISALIAGYLGMLVGALFGMVVVWMAVRAGTGVDAVFDGIGKRFMDTRGAQIRGHHSRRHIS